MLLSSNEPPIFRSTAPRVRPRSCHIISDHSYWQELIVPHPVAEEAGASWAATFSVTTLEGVKGRKRERTHKGKVKGPASGTLILEEERQDLGEEMQDGTGTK